MPSGYVEFVKNENELIAAIADKNIKKINFVNDINLSEDTKLQILNEKHIDGNGNKLIASDKDSWSSNYALQFYKTNGSVKNLTIENADAAILVNGSNVDVDNITMNNMEFGGMEVSQGSGVEETPQLNYSNITFENELLPTIWIDGKTTNDSWVNGEGLKEVKKTEKDQLWFIDKNIDQGYEHEEIITEFTTKDDNKLGTIEELTFLVKSMLNSNQTGQKKVTFDDLKNHFNNDYTENDGFIGNITVDEDKLEISNPLITSELWQEIKSKEDANKNAPYRITVLYKADGKDKACKIAIDANGNGSIEEIENNSKKVDFEFINEETENIEENLDDENLSNNEDKEESSEIDNIENTEEDNDKIELDLN